jgi:hypothetical protein
MASEVVLEAVAVDSLSRLFCYSLLGLYGDQECALAGSRSVLSSSALSAVETVPFESNATPHHRSSKEVLCLEGLACLLFNRACIKVGTFSARALLRFAGPPAAHAAN